MNKIRKEPRAEHIHVDWITLRGNGASKRGAELLKQVRDAIGIQANTFREGYGGGFYWQQFSNLGLRISTSEDGVARIELQGLFFNGGQVNPFQEFQRILVEAKKIKEIEWRLTRVDVAIDVYGLNVKEAFPDPSSKKYNFKFKFGKTDHSDNDNGSDLQSTGYTLRKKRKKNVKSRWTLSIYDKRKELVDSDAHQIKKQFFKILSNDDAEPITRIELRIATAQALTHVQGILNTPCEENQLCQVILSHWARYHRITTQNGNDERRFKRLFRRFQPKPFEKISLKKISEMPEQYEEITIRDKAREYLRYGLNKACKSPEDLIQIIYHQIEFLKETEGLGSIPQKPQGRNPKGDPSGSP